MVAVPDRLSATKLAYANPSLVLAWGSIRPRSVMKNTTVPSGTKVPAGSTTMAVTAETPPFAATNVGLTLRLNVELEGAVSGTPAQVRWAMARTAASSLGFDIVFLPPVIETRPHDPGPEASPIGSRFPFAAPTTRPRWPPHPEPFP